MAEKSLQNLLKKSNGITMKVTTKISGKTKDNFVNDCLNKDKLECNMAKHIIEMYYQITQEIPNIQYMDLPEVKKYIVEKIKFLR